jgi:gluconate 2-dehydrogenase gamma chain
MREGGANQIHCLEWEAPPLTSSETSRRQFLLRSGMGVSWGWLCLRWPDIRAAQVYAQRAANSNSPVEFKFFAPKMARDTEAIAAQIIPADITPGAREAHVIYFIDNVLATFEKDKQPAYKQGLKMLQQKTSDMFPTEVQFSLLSSAQQIELLKAIDGTEFFELVRLHTIMGYLSAPEYGGNYGQAGWKLIGFENEMIYEPPFGYYDANEMRRK